MIKKEIIKDDKETLVLISKEHEEYPENISALQVVHRSKHGLDNIIKKIHN